MSKTYTVQVNETIRDVVINSTGSMKNWDAICQANGFLTWTPTLVAGQSVIIPDSVSIDTNTQENRSSYPANNGTVPGYLQILQTVWDIINNRWILRTGFWDNSGIWINSDVWQGTE